MTTYRPIRSYVLRQGRVTAAQKQAHAELLPQFGIPYQAAPVNLERVFGRTAPKILEIGFGMGETTARIAQRHPENDYLGVEVHTPGVGSLLRRIRELALTNVRIIQHDAVEALRDMIDAESLDGAHIFFPDPWPKKRHHKRRLIQPPLPARGDRLGRLRATDPGRARRRAPARQHRGELRAAAGMAAGNEVRGPWTKARSPRVGRTLPPQGITAAGRSGSAGRAASARWIRGCAR
jgi:protein-L-isoaspartate O-methyltransferase